MDLLEKEQDTRNLFLDMSINLFYPGTGIQKIIRSPVGITAPHSGVCRSRFGLLVAEGSSCYAWGRRWWSSSVRA